MPSYAGYSDPTGVPSPPSSRIYRGDVVTQQEAEDAGGIGASTDLWIGASELILSRGAPATVTPTGSIARYWVLDSATLESVAGIVELPSGWATFDVDFWWTNHGAGAGDVVLRADYQQKADTQDISAGSSLVSATVTAGAQNIVKVSTVASGIAVVASSVLAIAATRLGADAADTLANDIGVLGIMLRKAS